MAANAHALLQGTPQRGRFIHHISLSTHQERKMREARDLIRPALTKAFKEWDLVIQRGDLFKSDFSLDGKELPALTPRYRMQGSVQYKTVNDPAQKPQQEADLDDGLFLPVTILKAHGKSEPVILTGGLFRIVELGLKELCEEQGWKLINTKSTCVRVGLPEVEAHIDIPIYAIPDQKYQLLEKSLNSKCESHNFDRGYDQNLLLEEAYRALESGQIMLAHRTEGWWNSDPRQLEDWFQEAANRHGPQLRRICRYLKAWRDYKWVKGGVSSIALMRCVVDVFDKYAGAFERNRDDMALLLCARELPTLFCGPLVNPVEHCPAFDMGWSDEERKEYIREARQLVNSLEMAIEQSTRPDDTVVYLRQCLGLRVPDDHRWVTISTAAIVPANDWDALQQRTSSLSLTQKSARDTGSYA